MSGSNESSSESATKSQEEEEEEEDDHEEGGGDGGVDDSCEQFKTFVQSKLIECWEKQESCCLIKIDEGKKYKEANKSEKWLTKGKMDMKKILHDPETFISEKKEKSNAQDELVAFELTLKKAKRDMSSKIETIDKEDTWGKREEKAYQGLENVIEQFIEHVSRRPLTKEILDKLQNTVKTSTSKFLKKKFTANTFPNVTEKSEIYSIEIDKDFPMLQVSIPSKYGEVRFEDVLEKHDRRIFIPSYMRANCAQLDWTKAGVDLKKTLQILVVRPSEFKKYREWHGGRIPIVSLPNNVIGIGYARHWILKIATYFRLRFIWMVDDDIKCFHGYDENGKSVDILSFELVFSQIERFVEETKELAAMSPVIFRPKASPKKPPPAFLRKPPRAVVCLDLELINDKKVSYRPGLKSFEDMLFGGECERKGLKVVMCNSILARCLMFKHTGVHSAYQTGRDSKETGELKTAPVIDMDASKLSKKSDRKILSASPLVSQTPPPSETQDAIASVLIDMDISKLSKESARKILSTSPLVSQMYPLEMHDVISKSLLPSEFKDCIPLQATPDGDCLFNSMSILLMGNESLTELLRRLTVLELFAYSEFYVCYLKREAQSRDVEETALFETYLTDNAALEVYNGKPKNASLAIEVLAEETAKPFVFSSPFVILALASVISKPIYSVCPDIPSCSAMKKAVHGVFYPRQSFSSDSDVTTPRAIPADTMYIMWTRAERSSTKNWEPNHFVPLVNVLRREVDTSSAGIDNQGMGPKSKIPPKPSSLKSPKTSSKPPKHSSKPHKS